jgi:hypothetical protein
VASRRAFVSVILVVGIIAGLSIAGLYMNLSHPLQVPPPTHLPGSDPEVFMNGKLAAWAEAVYWQDFMPSIPTEGPPFLLVVDVNVTNTGTSTIAGLEIPRLTIYFNGTSNPLVTLNLQVVSSELSEIGPGESFVIQLTNDRDTIFSPSIEKGTALYSRVLLEWETGNTMILTTPPSALHYTY